ncbi:MAG: J domain-containing protein [Fimbriimonadaceae bacterium]|nr:J domain-containing protein [Fimbriimonadaceae bacterium]
MSKVDYYGVLEVNKKADEKAIKAAYRKLARKYHPDVNPNNPDAEAKFKQISEAYAVLSDPDRRAHYDRFGTDKDSDGPPQWEGANVQFTGFGDIFEQFLGGGMFGSRTGFEEARDLELPIAVTLEEVNSGARQTITYQTDDACPGCRGSGQVRTKNGIGPCPRCLGRGYQRAERRVDVKIPAGIQAGKKLRVPGGGHRGANGRGGDLYLIIGDAAGQAFRRNGDNVETDLEVSFTTAALGGEVKVNTPNGSATVKVPAGTQSGQVLRLKNQGLTKLNGGKGDLHARIKVTVPRELTDEQRQLLAKLRELEGSNPVAAK